MAQLKDLVVSGDARIVGKLYADQALPDGVFYLANVSGTAAVTSSPYTSSKWYTTVDDSRITKLYSGLTVSLKIPVAGNGSYGTVLNVNGLGDHPVVYNVNTMISTRYGVGSTIILVYNATQTATGYANSSSATTYTGCWQMEDYDTTNVNQLREGSANCFVNSSAGALYRYQICLTNKNNELIPYNNVSNATTTYTKVVNSQPFDPFGTIYHYNYTDTVNAGASAAASRLYYHVTFDTRYSFNIDSSGTAGTTAFTNYKPIYIKALYNKVTHTATLTQNVSSSNYFERSGITQALPISNPDTGLADGTCYIYILLGRAYSKYQAELSIDHPVYAWDSINSCMVTIDSMGGNVPNATSSVVGGLKVRLDDNTHTLYITNNGQDA